MKKYDLTNQRFGRLTVLKPGPNKGQKTTWICQCDCGNITTVMTNQLTSGKTKSCGCFQKEQASKASLKNYTGYKQGYLEVLERDLNYQGKQSRTHWICICHKCNNLISMPSASLAHGAISCGCAKSKGDYKIMTLLQQYHISFQTEYKFDDAKNRRYDFAIINKENKVVRLIEFDGIQHYYRPRADHWAATSSLEETQKRDMEKNILAKQHNIPLVRIPYWKLEELTIFDLLDDKFLVKEQVQE